MKSQELIVNCFYADAGVSIQDIVLSSFSTFLKKEFEKFASVAHAHV